MPELVPLFRLRLSNQFSIGPRALRAIWAAACGTREVGVKRTETEVGPGEHAYSFDGPPATVDLYQVESRLRLSLASEFPATIIHLTAMPPAKFAGKRPRRS